MLKNAFHLSRLPAVRRVLTSVLVLLAVFASAGPLLAQGFDPLKKPVLPVPVPANWTGALTPTKILGDSSWWNFGSTPTQLHPFWHDVDVENGWIFATTGRGLQVFDARTAPNSPTPSPTNGQYFFAGTSTVPDWHQNDTKFYLFGLDAPAGEDGVVAVASISGNGMLIFDTRNKGSVARLVYQDNSKSGTQVWSTTYNNTHYAFYAATNNKVLVYNLSAALALTTFNNAHGCLDESPASIPCQDPQGRKVYAGKINTQFGVNYLHGAGNYLAVSEGAQVEIWKVDNPASPQQVLKFSPPGQSAGVAMWQEGSSYYLAVVQLGNTPPRNLRIYDVTCVTTASCGAAPPLAGTYQMNHSAPTSILFATFSRAAGVPYLYLGGEDQFSGGPQREYLVDVSTPSNPVEVTPPFPPTGYWGWYYYGLTPPGQPGGYNWVMPRTAKLATIGSSTHLYRAAFSLFDVHRFGGSTPTAGFSYTPATVYAGDQVNFSDQSSGNVTSWSWTFAPDGAPPTSTAQHPQNVSFSTPGPKSVTLTINGTGDSETQALTVLDPTPVVGNVSITPAAPRVCQRISFAGVGVTGKPSLTYGWEVLDASGNPLIPSVTGGNTTTFDWQTNSGTPAAGYRIKLTVSNTAGSGNKEVPFTLAALTPLPDAGFPLPNPGNPPGATVTFTLPATSAPSASEWSWNFGDNLAGPNGGWTAWDSNPVTGPTQTHTYAATGTYTVKVRVRNCVEPVGPANELGVESQAISITVTQLINLVANFEAFCLGGFCGFSTTDAVLFLDHSTGAQLWDYDWNGDGTFEDAGRTTPATSHTFSTPGRYRPKLKVRAGSATSDVFTLAQELIITQGSQQTPGITLTGPTSANIGQNVTINASASNCTAAANGWTWDTAGGTGSSTTNSITLSWPSAGAKVVKATNTGCGGAQGTRTVTVSSGGGGGPGPLQARFIYSPVPALPNQPVTFNGSSSTGNPTLYLWDFGDSTPTATGAQVTHTFTQSGTFTVRLMVSAPSSACPPQPFCESQTQQAVVVIGSPLGASFNSDICHAELSFVVCNTDVNVEVTFVDASTGNIVSRNWDFGDGETATGTIVRHTYRRAGTFPLTLTVSDGTRSVSFTRNIIVAGPLTEAMVLPWIAKTVEGPMLQTSDLYLHNPGGESIDVSLEFRQRGTPETVPPKAVRTIAPNATLFVSDLVKSLFNRENISGFLAVTVDRGGVQPVVVSFNTTFRSNSNGEEFGQTVPGFLLSNTGAASTAGNLQVQHLVGLNDNDERIAYFGLSNPGNNPATYRLRFFDNLGHEIGTGSQQITLARYGFKQYQPRDIRTLFGLSDKDDYRVLVESSQGAPIFPFGANLRLGSLDPSFLTVGSGAEQVYLLGMLSTPGPNNSTWRSDVVLSNTSNQVVIVDLTYTNVGLTSTPTDTIHETLQPGESRRLADVIGTKWNVRNGVGVLTLESNAPGGLFPLVQGESYDSTNPARRYGQTLPAVTAEQAAGAGEAQYLVGLREDAKSRTTFWVHNPGPDSGSYEIVFRGLDGQDLGRIRNLNIPAGKLRQFNKAQFPAGLPGTFTVQVLVRSGKVLTAAQVVNNVTNDPAYVQGETR